VNNNKNNNIYQQQQQQPSFFVFFFVCFFVLFVLFLSGHCPSVRTLLVFSVLKRKKKQTKKKITCPRLFSFFALLLFRIRL